jgi:hypothetical protein
MPAPTNVTSSHQRNVSGGVFSCEFMLTNRHSIKCQIKEGFLSQEILLYVDNREVFKTEHPKTTIHKSFEQSFDIESVNCLFKCRLLLGGIVSGEVIVGGHTVLNI